jgi:hypothetical protein
LLAQFSGLLQRDHSIIIIIFFFFIFIIFIILLLSLFCWRGSVAERQKYSFVPDDVGRPHCHK